MAERRMFTKKITEADEFTAMPPTTQALYFHLCMNCDDDGFSNQIRQSMFNAHASTDDLNTLVNKRFVIPFESGVIVIKHWKMHNIIRNDRYHETQYLEEKSTLLLKENGVYTERMGDNLDTIGIPNDNQMETEVRLGKDRLDKVSLGKDNITASEDSSATKPKPQKHRYGEYNHVLLTDAEHEKLENEFGLDMTTACITYLDEYIEMKGYKAKSHYLAIRKWVLDAVHRQGSRTQNRPQEKSLLDKLWEV